jgi:hypothetical protein
MNPVTDPVAEVLTPPTSPSARTTPIEEYIAVLRSYLTEAQKAEVWSEVEGICQRAGAPISTMHYAEVLQSRLTPWQKAGVYERLETIYEERGWLDQHAA